MFDKKSGQASRSSRSGYAASHESVTRVRGSPHRDRARLSWPDSNL